MNMVDIREAALLVEKSLPNNIIIFEHIAAHIGFSKDLDDFIYRITDDRLFDYEIIEELNSDRSLAGIIYDNLVNAISSRSRKGSS